MKNKRFCDLKVGDSLYISKNKKIKQIFFQEIQQGGNYWIITNENKICCDKEDLEDCFITLRYGAISTSMDKLLLEIMEC